MNVLFLDDNDYREYLEVISDPRWIESVEQVECDDLFIETFNKE